MRDLYSYCFFVDGILKVVVFSESDSVIISALLHNLYPDSSIELRIF